MAGKPFGTDAAPKPSDRALDDPGPSAASDSVSLRPSQSGPARASTTPPFQALRVGASLVSGRFEIRRYIGRGGMGMVYEAFDERRRTPVALKTLSQADAEGIYLLKNEFRALTDVRHENLVRLHELFSEQGLWFFTMDLIDGVTFTDWVRPGDVLDLGRLRSALAQLVEGVGAIHAAGKLHRDIKPSNVLVTRSGRVAILDFGLIGERPDDGRGQTASEAAIVGTPAYMAPEQAMAQQETTASDTYGVGAMLFTALSGRPPFEGAGAEVLLAKMKDAPPLLSDDSLPKDLIELCHRMLARDPAERPLLAELRERLGSHEVASDPSAATLVDDAVGSSSELLGRDGELEALRRAFATTLQEERAVMVSVSGESGIGKTALCEAFVEELRRSRGVRVLAGRCYERETVPYKAVDAVVDRLARYLKRLPAPEAAALLPRDAFALAQLFPVLNRVESFASAPAKVGLPPLEIQRRGFAALGELLARLRDRTPVVILLDDLQWTDVDSVTLLRQMLLQHPPVPVLFLVSYRSTAENGLVSRVLDAARSNPGVELSSLTLGPLGFGAVRELATRWLAADASQDVSAAIAKESDGSPFLASELARFRKSGEPGTTSHTSLNDVIRARLEKLSPGARRMLDCLAVAECPLPETVLRDASQATDGDGDALEVGHLLRGSQDGGVRVLEFYHDRIRETLRDHLEDAARPELYRVLAAALSQYEGADPELLSRCFEGAGDSESAERYAILAAQAANTALAFEQAAKCHRHALRLAGPSSARRSELLTQLGIALENAGRGREAADTFEQASHLADGEERLELRRRAAEQLLATGYVEEGTDLLREVCEAVDFPLPKETSIPSILWLHARLRFRSLTPRDAPPVLSPVDQLRLRAAHTATTGLHGYVPIASAAAAVRYLNLALDTGDVPSLVRSMSFNGFVLRHLNAKSTQGVGLSERAEQLMQRDGRPELIGFVNMWKGVLGMQAGQHFGEVREILLRAIDVLRGCVGVAWELETAEAWEQVASYWAGEYAYISRTLPTLLDEASRRGRVWSWAVMSGPAGLAAWLTRDDPEGYARQLAEARQRWGKHDPPLGPDLMMAMGEALLHLYNGDAARGYDTLEGLRADFLKGQVIKRGMGLDMFETTLAWCSAAAMRAADGGRYVKAMRTREAYLRKTGRSHLALKQLRDAQALADGDLESARIGLADTVEGWDRIGCRMRAAATRIRLGQLLGGDEGRELRETGEAFMRGQGVVNLERMTEVNCPGCTV